MMDDGGSRNGKWSKTKVKKAGEGSGWVLLVLVHQQQQQQEQHQWARHSINPTWAKVGGRGWALALPDNNEGQALSRTPSHPITPRPSQDFVCLCAGLSQFFYVFPFTPFFPLFVCL